MQYTLEQILPSFIIAIFLTIILSLAIILPLNLCKY